MFVFILLIKSIAWSIVIVLMTSLNSSKCYYEPDGEVGEVKFIHTRQSNAQNKHKRMTGNYNHTKVWLEWYSWSLVIVHSSSFSWILSEKLSIWSSTRCTYYLCDHLNLTRLTTRAALSRINGVSELLPHYLFIRCHKAKETHLSLLLYLLYYASSKSLGQEI